MNIQQLTLTDFKNYEKQSITLDPGVNLLFGANAQGKTNLLESVFYLSSLRSFRPLKDKEIIRFGAQKARIEALVQNEDDQYTLDVSICPGERRQIFVNGVKITKVTDIVSLVATVLFCPDDLSLIRESSARRRRFMNMALCQMKPRYLALLAEYNKLLEHKQSILKNAAQNPSMGKALDVFNRRMAEVSAPIIRYRAAFTQSLCSVAAQIHRDIAPDEQLDLQYVTARPIKDPLSLSPDTICDLLTEYGERMKNAELGQKTALFGVHKDDLIMTINRVHTRQFASQGQARSAALALKLGEREVFYRESGKFPILLLDDILSELDDARRQFILSRLGTGQVLLTSCNAADKEYIAAGQVLTIQNGRVL